MVPLSFKEITERLKSMDLPEFDLVIGIGTGGVVPASLVAFHLGCELKIITVNFRDIRNNPRFEKPVLVSEPEHLNLKGKRVLLADDVSVSGKTLETALQYLNHENTKTLTMKGKADYVLFPEIQECVNWPWKP